MKPIPVPDAASDIFASAFDRLHENASPALQQTDPGALTVTALMSVFAQANQRSGGWTAHAYTHILAMFTTNALLGAVQVYTQPGVPQSDALNEITRLFLDKLGPLLAELPKQAERVATACPPPRKEAS